MIFPKVENVPLALLPQLLEELFVFSCDIAPSPRGVKRLPNIFGVFFCRLNNLDNRSRMKSGKQDTLKIKNTKECTMCMGLRKKHSDSVITKKQKSSVSGRKGAFNYFREPDNSGYNVCIFKSPDGCLECANIGSAACSQA